MRNSVHLCRYRVYFAFFLFQKRGRPSRLDLELNVVLSSFIWCLIDSCSGGQRSWSVVGKNTWKKNLQGSWAENVDILREMD